MFSTTYDGDGKRVKKSNGKLYWYGMGADPLSESDLAGTLIDDYIFFNGKRIARQNISSGNRYFYFSDHLGTTRVIAQAGVGSPCYDADYYPFGGEAAIAVNSCPTNYKFTGKERDSESGLDNFGARFDSSSLGRFMSPDPVTLSWRRWVNPQLWNAYTYVGNNPLRFVDPTGEELVQLGQHTDSEIKKRKNEIKQELKNKDLTKEQKDALKKERNTLNLEQEGNHAVGNMLADLNKRDPGNGLKLSDFTLSTDTKNDFAGKLSDKDLKSALGAQAFVPQGYGALSQTIYIRTEPSTGFYQMSQSNSDFVHYGASALAHEGAHRFSHFNEWNAFTSRTWFSMSSKMISEIVLYMGA